MFHVKQRGQIMKHIIDYVGSLLALVAIGAIGVAVGTGLVLTAPVVAIIAAMAE